jgi:ferredoxin
VAVKLLRKVIRIDEEKCNGCGICVPACAEHALEIIDGKARLVNEKYCDGLGTCLGECPQGAIIIEERVVEQFDEEAARRRVTEEKPEGEELPCGCSSATVTGFAERAAAVSPEDTGTRYSTLGHWPVQLTLVPPSAPFLKGADVILAADCVPFAYGDFHRVFLVGRALLVACPKLDDFAAHQQKLNDILAHSEIKTLTVVHMEVPCCSGLLQMARQAVTASGKDIPLREVTISMKGDVIGEGNAV